MKTVALGCIVLFLFILLAVSGERTNDNTLDFEYSSTSFTVDYGKTLKELVSEGNYKNIDFPKDYREAKDILTYQSINSIDSIVDQESRLQKEHRTDKVKVEGRIFTFNKNITRDVVAMFMEPLGYRPATLYEFLAFSKERRHPYKQLKICTLSPIWKDRTGRCYTPTVFVYNDTREIMTTSSFDKNEYSEWEREYNTSFGFLGVRK